MRYVPSVTPFPAHPPGFPWPTEAWPAGAPDDDVDAAAVDESLRAIRDTPAELGMPLATLAIHRGRLVAEQYCHGMDVDSTLISWSMAKSMTQAVIGMLVFDGRLDIDAPAAVPEFAGTAKRAITVRDLLAMKSGLEFVEDYVDDSISHCLDMLFGGGQHDHAAYAAELPLLHQPGEVWNYSSGTTNILARLAGSIIGGPGASGPEPMRTFLRERLFGPIGMASAEPKFDTAGTFVGSSYVYATARDFAKFGYLYLRDGVWDGTQLLPSGWVDYTRTEVAVDPDPPHFGYGSQWWIWRDQPGSLAAHGYEGQYIIVLPQRDLVVVQLSKVPTDVRGPLLHKLDQLVAAFPATRAG